MRLSFVLVLAGAAGKTYAWGAVGHAVVATIAQIHLHQSAIDALNVLLPGYKGQLAPIAAWADRIRGIPGLAWTSNLHYVGAIGDYPPTRCSFGENGGGWVNDRNVLTAIANFTQNLVDDPKDGLSIRLLTHFVGDAHMPLHLTDRERGGNGDPVIFEGRRMNLHGLWDGALITKAIREQHNYTARLPSPMIEGSLRGSIYDNYIRLILWEGVRVWWRESLEEWLTCPSPLDMPSASASQLMFTDGERRNVIDQVCPEHWARQTHAVTCNYVFPANYDAHSPKELNTAAYYGRIRNDNVVEKLLAQGGIRLAATLNAIFASPDDLAFGPVANWMNDADLVA